MFKDFILTLIFAFLNLLVSGQENYHLIINYATAPGAASFNSRFFKFSNDTLTLIDGGERYFMNPQKDHYDTSYYPLTSLEKQHIINTLKSDSLKNAINPCYLDGLRFFLSYGFDTTNHQILISNAYDERIFQLVDIVNDHVPTKTKIHYNKEELLAQTKGCCIK